MKKIILLLAFVLVFGLAGCGTAPVEEASAALQAVSPEETAALNDEKNSIELDEPLPVENEEEVEPQPDTAADDTMYAYGLISMIGEPFSSLESMISDETTLIAGLVVSSETVFRYNNLYTCSNVEITEVFKGYLMAGDIIPVMELGGHTTWGEYTKNTEAPEKVFIAESFDYPDSRKMVHGIDGYYPLKLGDEVLLSLLGPNQYFEDYIQVYSVDREYEGRLFKESEDLYRAILPSNTDERVFDENGITVTMEQLQDMKQKYMD